MRSLKDALVTLSARLLTSKSQRIDNRRTFGRRVCVNSQIFNERSQSQTFRGNNVSSFENKATLRNFSRNYPENVNSLNSGKFMNQKFREQSLNNNYNNNSNRSCYVPPPLRQPDMRTPFKSLTCRYCRDEGHTMSNCFKLKNEEHQKTKPTGAVSHNSSFDQQLTVFDEQLLVETLLTLS